MTPRRSLGISFALSVLALSSCGGEKSSGPDPATMEKLLACQQERDRAKTSSEMCTRQLDEARAASAAPSNEYVVKLDGDVLTVLGRAGGGGGGGGGRVADLKPEDALKLSEAIVNQIRRSKPSIQQCYVSALKKNQSIQARTINLKILVSLASSGKVSDAQFSPSLGGDFGGCMQKIASSWRVPAFEGGALPPIEAQITLKPAE